MGMDARRWLNRIGKALPFQFGNGYLIVLKTKVFIVSTMFTLLGLHMENYPRHHPNHDGKWSLQAPCDISVVVKGSGCHVLFRCWARGSYPPKFCVNHFPIRVLGYIVHQPTQSIYNLRLGRLANFVEKGWQP